MFLELWKRKQAVIQWQWDLENYEEEEELRPEFEEKVTTTRINPVTNKPEPYLPLWSQITRLVATHSIVLLMVRVGCRERVEKGGRKGCWRGDVWGLWVVS